MKELEVTRIILNALDAYQVQIGDVKQLVADRYNATIESQQVQDGPEEEIKEEK